jgi:hypothetical protein
MALAQTSKVILFPCRSINFYADECRKRAFFAAEEATNRNFID